MPSNCIIQTQRRLDELHSYGYQRQPVGALRALTSNVNGSQVKQKLLADDGKIKKYQITYIEPDCIAPDDVLEIGDEGSDRCDAGTSKPISDDYKTITESVSSGVIELTDAQYRDLCNFGARDFTMAQILGKFDSMARAVNKKILTKLSASIGCLNADEAGPTEMMLVNPQTGVPVWSADVDIAADFGDAGMSVSPILIGGRTLLKYDKGIRNGSANGDGMNVGAMTNFPAFYDNQLQGVLGTLGKETVLAIAPQIVSYVNYLENVGDFQSNMKFDGDVLKFMREGEAFNYGIIEDPFTGLVYDMDVIFDSCTKKWKLSFRSWFDVWVMPLTQCYAECFTGIIQYDLCNASRIPCPA